MGKYEERMAELQKLRDGAADARRKRDEKELDEFFDLLLEEQNVLIRFPESTPDLPGHVVCHRPGPAQAQRFKAIMWKDAGQRGVLEQKQKAGADLARQCLVWPAVERYNALVEAYPMAPDKIAQLLIQAAEAGAEAEGKG